MNDVTRVLSAIKKGDPQAAEQLLPLVYNELRRLAASKMASEKPGQTLDATGLVHEAYLRLVGPTPSARRDSAWDCRGHFFAAAAEAMRRILVESARRKRRAKHGGGMVRAELSIDQAASLERPDEIAALDEALERLAKSNPEAVDLVKLRYFAGFSNAEAAALLGISPRKANQVWAYARAWLLDDLAASSGQ